MRAIQWRWPGARCVVRGGVLDEWHGPMAEPSAGELAQALADFAPVAEAVALDAAVNADIDRRFMAAYTWVLLKRQFPSDTDAQTKTKLAAMRDAVVTEYLAQPWK